MYDAFESATAAAVQRFVAAVAASGGHLTPKTIRAELTAYAAALGVARAPRDTETPPDTAPPTNPDE